MHRFVVLALAAAACAVGCFAPAGIGESAETHDAIATPIDAAAPTCLGGTSQVSILATAPTGLDRQHLGRPLGASFEVISGEDGASLFPKAEIHESTLNTIEHKVTSIDDTRGLSASVSGWGLFSADAKNASSSRYASYRASQYASAVEIDDGTSMRTPPPGAVYYPAKIIYGHSFEMVLSGDTHAFNAGVKAKLFSFSGSISGFATSNNLTASAVGRGLQPVNGNAIFASSADDIEKAYEATGDAVPILVEYRSLPTACVPATTTISWNAPTKYTVSFQSVDVYRDADGQWSLDAACTVNDQNVELANRTVWDHQGGIGESCTKGDPGPQNDKDFCTSNMFWSTDIEASEGDTIKCSISGTAWGNKKPIAPAGFSWTAAAAGTSGKFGDGNGSTEYWLQYAVKNAAPAKTTL